MIGKRGMGERKKQREGNRREAGKQKKQRRLPISVIPMM